MPAARGCLHQRGGAMTREFDHPVHDTVLGVAVSHGGGVVGGVPLEVDGHRSRCPVGSTQRLIGVVERGADRLVADRPLPHRDLADVLRPELLPLDERPVGTRPDVEVDDVDQRRVPKQHR